jgi:hypothetical protein
VACKAARQKFAPAAKKWRDIQLFKREQNATSIDPRSSRREEAHFKLGIPRGIVIINAKVLDKDANNALIFVRLR